jgi:hypothetical protein
MTSEEICHTLSLPREQFEKMKERFRGWDMYHRRTIFRLQAENKRMKIFLFMSPPSAKRGRRRFSEMQIDCTLAMIRCGLATPDQVCRMFEIRLEQLQKWESMHPTNPKDGV